jgi:LSD1 subclass zinc finger protein
VPAVLLTCPKCRSGLEVPDGTTALVRCPACKTVFKPSDSAAPEPEEEEKDAEDEGDEKPKARKPKRAEDKPKKPRKSKRDEDEDDEDEEEKPKAENRDFDPITDEEDRKRKRKRRRPVDDELTPEEKAARRSAFIRATWGVRLIWISFVLFMFSMLLIGIYFFQFGVSRFVTPTPAFVTAAGFFGLLNWILAAVGVGLCLSGPRAPGHWGYGIAAAVAVVVHGIFVLVLVAQDREYCVGRNADRLTSDTGSARWSMLATRLDVTTFYLTAVLYPTEQTAVPSKDPMTLSMVTGVLEMIRTVLIMMLLSCMAQAALDKELAHKCTRTAGIASGGPGLVALLMLGFVAFVVETNAGINLFTLIVLLVVHMSVYAILAAVILPAYMAAREVADACEEPFQSLIPQL